MSLDINRLRPNAGVQGTLHSLFSHNWRGMFIGKAGAGKTYVFKKADQQNPWNLKGIVGKPVVTQNPFGGLMERMMHICRT